MTAQYALGRQEEALAGFERCRRLLVDELGVDPLDRTVALHRAILRHADVAALLAGTSSPSETRAPEPVRWPLPVGLAR